MKTRKRSNKTKSKKNKTLKYHVLPSKSKKTIWSGDFIGEREVTNYKDFMARKHVDNMNPIQGKFKDNIEKEYKRRLKNQLKKSK